MPCVQLSNCSVVSAPHKSAGYRWKQSYKNQNIWQFLSNALMWSKNFHFISQKARNFYSSILIQIFRTLRRMDASCFILWHSMNCNCFLASNNEIASLSTLWKSVRSSSVPKVGLTLPLGRYYFIQCKMYNGYVAFVTWKSAHWLHRQSRQAVLCRSFLQPGTVDIMRMSELPASWYGSDPPPSMHEPPVY